MSWFEDANAVVVNTPFQESRAIWVGGAGNMTVTMKDGKSVTFTAVPAGSLIPIAAINVTAATATSIIALR